MFRLKLLQNKLALGVAATLLVIAVIALAITWLAAYYRSGEFFFDFATNIVATVIGIVIGALLAIFVTIAVINPYVRHKEERRLEPLRRPMLLFWDHTLTLYTMGVLQAVDCPAEIVRAVSDVSMELSLRMDTCVDEEKLIGIQKWLKDLVSREELSVRSPSYFKQTLDELRDFIERMHSTLVALPSLFKETPEVAIGVEVLLGGFLSGLKMLEYKVDVDHELKTTKLDFYSTAIIKNTAHDALSLVGEIRQARLRHQ